MFLTLDFETSFRKTKTLFKKLEYLSLVDGTMAENATCPYKTVLSKAKVKANRIRSTKWTYNKEWGF